MSKKFYPTGIVDVSVKRYPKNVVIFIFLRLQALKKVPVALERKPLLKQNIRGRVIIVSLFDEPQVLVTCYLPPANVRIFGSRTCIHAVHNRGPPSMGPRK
jgi:hypothetical protein